MTDVALPRWARGSYAADENLDHEAFTSFYAEFAPRVRALAARRLRNRDLADDVVQETLLRCFRARDRFDGARPAWPWVRTIATNVCIDMVRGGAGWRELPSGIDALEPPSPGLDTCDPAHAYVSHERRECITEALSALTPRQRRVVLLRDAEGWRADDVAAMEGSSTEAVKAALKRGRQVFRVAYSATADARGLLGAVVACGYAIRRVVRAKAAASPAASLKTQLISATSAVVATGIATIVVVSVAGGWPGANTGTRVIDAPRASMVSSTSPLANAAAPAAHGADAASATAGSGVAEPPAEVAPRTELRRVVTAPVPGDQPVVLVEVYVTTDCEGPNTRRLTCTTAAIAGQTPGVPPGL